MERQAGTVLRQRLFQMERAVRDVRRQARPSQRNLGNRLDPDGLPDAGRAGVEAAVRRIRLRLLAARLGRFPVVARPDDDRERVAAGDGLQGRGEGREAATVPDDLHAVHPDGRIIIHRPEVQQDVAASPLRRHLDRLAIPDGRHEVGMPQPGQRRLGAERDRDLVGKVAAHEVTRVSAVSVVDLKLPFAVQAQPVGADELRAGVLGAGDSHGYSFAKVRL